MKHIPLLSSFVHFGFTCRWNCYWNYKYWRFVSLGGGVHSVSPCQFWFSHLPDLLITPACNIRTVHTHKHWTPLCDAHKVMEQDWERRESPFISLCPCSYSFVLHFSVLIRFGFSCFYWLTLLFPCHYFYLFLFLSLSLSSLSPRHPSPPIHWHCNVTAHDFISPEKVKPWMISPI